MKQITFIKVTCPFFDFFQDRLAEAVIVFLSFGLLGRFGCCLLSFELQLVVTIDSLAFIHCIVVCLSELSVNIWCIDVFEVGLVVSAQVAFVERRCLILGGNLVRRLLVIKIGII